MYIINPQLKKTQSGFSIAEVLIVLFVIAIVVMLALPQINSSRRLFRFSGVQRQVINALREARQHAISQRQQITFKYENAEKRLRLFGGTFGNSGDSNNQIFELTGDGVVANELIYGRPTGTSVSALGDGTNLTSLASNAVEITFQKDGSVIDASNNPLNKALFFYDSSTPDETAFAVSILGAGGRVKVWRFNSSANIYVE